MTASTRAWELRQKLFALVGEFKEFHSQLSSLRGRSGSLLEARQQADATACALAGVYDRVSGPAAEFDLFIDAARDGLEYPFPLKKSNGEVPDDFALLLSKAREAAKLSIPELAARSGVSDDAIRLYEAGKRAPMWDNVQKLAKALGVPTDAFRDT